MMALQRTSGCWTWSIQVAAVGCCRWTDTCNGSLRVCCSGQSWILMFRSVNLHLMTLHKTTQIECSNSCPKLANSRGLSEVSRTGFLNRLKCKKVGIDKEKTSRVIVREKLSKRAVVKEVGLGWVYLQERRLTPIGT